MTHNALTQKSQSTANSFEDREAVFQNGYSSVISEATNLAVESSYAEFEEAKPSTTKETVSYSSAEHGS